MKAAPLLAALLLGAGCRTISTAEVSSASTPRVRVGALARTWEVRSGEETLGLVVQFLEAGRASDAIYVVRNPWNQDLGWIDGLGRAYRYLPHHRDPAWVGSGTVLAGATQILNTSLACELVEVSPADGTPHEGSKAPASSVSGGASDAPETPPAPPSPDGGLPQSR